MKALRIGVSKILYVEVGLNIFHDYTISHQIDTSCSTEVELVDKSKECDKVDNLHHFFHFSAIVTIIKDELSLVLQNIPLFISTHPPFIVLQTSFKPPKI